MKKLLAVLLVLCLFVGMMPMAFAEGSVEETPAETENVGGTETNVSTEPESATPTTDETPAEPVEDKEIDSLEALKDAIKAVGSNGTVTLEENISGDVDIIFGPNAPQPFTLDGDGKTITGDVNVQNSSVVFTNLNIVGTLNVKDASVVLQGCRIVDENVAINITGESMSVVSVVGTELTSEVPIMDTTCRAIVSNTLGLVSYEKDGVVYYTDNAPEEPEPGEEGDDDYPQPPVEEPTVTPEPKPPVKVIAVVGDTTYETLESALNDNTAGKTIELIDDYTMTTNAALGSGEKLVIRGGAALTIPSGYSLTNNGIIINYGTVSGITENHPVLTSLSFTVAPAGADIELYYYWHDELRPVNREGNSYLVPNGTYRYVVSYGGYDSEYGDVTVSGTARTIRVQLDEHPEYRVYIANTEHGSVSVDTRYAEEGEWVYITVNPNAGYRLSDLTVTRPSGNTVKVEHVRGNVFRFAMPGVRVTVDAEFVRTTMPFTDVSRGQWFYDAVSFVYWRDIMDGVTSTQFAPDATTTRAMVVQILYRMAGSPTVRGSSPFYDVSNGAWYADAVIWAEANDIVNGMTTTTFAPNTAVTREQLATMLYRYAQYRHYNTSAGANTNILSYYDANRISEYAFSALQWACGEGIVDGTGTGYLSPQGQATRAQLAAMLMRFCMEYRI